MIGANGCVIFRLYYLQNYEADVTIWHKSKIKTFKIHITLIWQGNAAVVL